MSEKSPPKPPDEARVLFRCPTPTNVLCPCGAIARRLRKLGLDHETERVPYNRRRRPEIEELTHQKRVPVLVDGEEVVHDSKRILQYLDWKYGAAKPDAGEARKAKPKTRRAWKVKPKTRRARKVKPNGGDADGEPAD